MRKRSIFAAVAACLLCAAVVVASTASASGSGGKPELATGPASGWVPANAHAARPGGGSHVSNLIWGGGPVMHSTTVVPIFWGSEVGELDVRRRQGDRPRLPVLACRREQLPAYELRVHGQHGERQHDERLEGRRSHRHVAHALGGSLDPRGPERGLENDGRPPAGGCVLPGLLGPAARERGLLRVAQLTGRSTAPRSSSGSSSTWTAIPAATRSLRAAPATARASRRWGT